MSGGWFLKALKHEYIDKRVLLVVTRFFVGMCEVGTARKMGAVCGTTLSVEDGLA